MSSILKISFTDFLNKRLPFLLLCFRLVVINFNHDGGSTEKRSSVEHEAYTLCCDSKAVISRILKLHSVAF